MDLKLACRRLYRATVPRVLRAALGRVLAARAWTRADERWRFQDYSAARWEREYRADKWQYMHALPELARYSVVVGYVQHLVGRGALLDLGCGQGILQARLGAAGYTRYVGVDISSEAIDAAKLRADERTQLVCADIACYEPQGLFEVIVLNEVLYYLRDPVGVLRHYERFLAPAGAFVISMFVTDETRANWRVLEACYDFVDQTVACNGTSGCAWDCRVARPRERVQRPGECAIRAP